MSAAERRLTSFVDKIRLREKPLLLACIAEFLGTVILMVFGAGVVAQVVLGSQGRDAAGGFLSISLGWGMAVTFGVFISGVAGSGNINPAMSLAMAVIGRLPFIRVPLYTLCQVLGAFVGALAVFGCYQEKIHAFAALHNNDHLFVNSTGGIFVTSPGGSALTAFLDQVLGTAILAGGALAITDFKGWKMPIYLHPLYVGLLVFSLVGAFGINAGAALNPARDFGPRLMIAICGWGTEAFSHGNYYFWIPIIGPYVGAILGAVLYEVTIGIHLQAELEQKPMRKSSSPSDLDKDLEVRMELLH